jgi:hypothetical protein
MKSKLIIAKSSITAFSTKIKKLTENDGILIEANTATHTNLIKKWKTQ